MDQDSWVRGVTAADLAGVWGLHSRTVENDASVASRITGVREECE